MAVTAPRGIRLNNPGNIRKSKDKWQGLDIEQPDPSFFQFKAPVWGIRAIARILIAYQDDHGCETVRDFIQRWAPLIENDTVAYVSDVCRRGNLDRNQQLDVHKYRDLKPMVVGIMWHENGQMPYSDAVIDEALRLAGVVPETTSTMAVVAKDPVARIAAAGTALGTIQGIISSASDIWDTLAQRLDPRYLIAATVLILAAVLVWRVVNRFQARRQGMA